MKHQIKSDPVIIYETIPAPKLQVLLWLVTFGRFGKTFVVLEKPGKRYKPFLDPRMQHINCRCIIKDLNKAP